MMNSVEVEIFGRKYRLRSDDPATTTAVSAEINNALRELAQQYDQLDYAKLLLLLCLTLEEKNLELSKANTELKTELERMNQMISAFINDNS